ncbi:MAG: P-loop NTPase [Micrococcales bacterium]|nr:P-loop NTPase [Micrococcales bacterium]
MEVGARAVVSRAASLAESVARLEGVALWVASARAVIGQDTVGRAGRTIAVAGAKGGVGASVIALLAARTLVGTKSVGLVDFDLQAGDLAPFLGVQARRSVVDLVDIATDMPGRVLRETTYEVQGLRLLSAPSHGERAEAMTVRAARAVASALRYQFDVSVIDVGSHLTEVSAAMIEDADQVVLVTTADMPALRSAKRTLAMWERLVVRSPGTVQVVLNRMRKNSEITRQLASRVVEVPVAGVAIPDGGVEFERLMNTASLLEGSTAVSKAVAALVPPLVQPATERSVDEAVEEIDAARRQRQKKHRRSRREKGQAIVETPVVVMVGLLMFFFAFQGLALGMSHLFAREAARESARIVAIEGYAPAGIQHSEQVAHDRIPGGWDTDTHVAVSEADKTVTVDIAVPAVLPWTGWRASATVPATGR